MTILIVNASVYILTLLIYVYKVRCFNLGTMLLSLYAVSACTSVFFYNHELFELSIHDSVMTWQPFIYLYIVLMIFFFPVLKFRSDKIESVEFSESFKFNVLVYLVIFTSLVCMVIYFPFMIKGMEGDIGENRTSVMTEGLKLDMNPIVSITVRVGIALRDIAILLFFYMLAYQREKRILLILLGICAFVAPIVVSLAWSARTIVLFLLFSFLTCYLLFYKTLTKKIKLTINWIFASVFGFLFIIFLIISFARFGENDLFGIDFFMLKYIGENFINFNGILYDQVDNYLYGGNSFPIFRRLLGLEYWTSIADFRDYADYFTGVPVWIFYLFVGTFYLDFGPRITFFIALVICVIGYRYFKNTPKIPFHRLILFILIYNMYTEGLFYFSLCDEPGNLKIIIHILLYFYFRIDFKTRTLMPA